MRTTAVEADTVSVPEAARRLGVHADYLNRLIRDGACPVPVITIGRVRRVGVKAIDDFINTGGTAK